ncbi:ABC transporter ATP-binding protein/permease [Basfia succiniciproducens]|uniref:ABC transporter ATP-binding protein/permease n=1 Tax=Basfia succiniciproducens TaxID=653940 RepID=UPI0008AFE5D5|nr:ABC transporter ATP-binding protein/permease [Basfia succiniciproducens]SEQ32542.1 putative ATP-binding cassette transporter [Basfia succiniciproducens]
MNWQTELNNSFSWLITTLIWVSLAFTFFALLLRKTDFGEKFWLVTKPCIEQSNKFKTIGLILFLFLLILLEVRISVLNSFFYNGLYSALQDKKADAFWFFATINAMLVGFKIIHSIINYLIRQIFEIRWLEKFNGDMLSRWLDHKNYYRLKYEKDLPDNIDQRIEQDAREFITGTVDLADGILGAIVSIIEFTIILWGLSGLLVLFDISIPKGVVFFIYTFIIIATALSVWIGYPLIKLNFNKEKLNGDYRYSLIRIRDNAESIAFYDGEQKERQYLNERFKAIIKNRWAIVRQMLGLDGFNTGVTQIAMILPLMLQAPRFFAGQATLGDMHQTVQAFNRLMRALSFFRLFYEQFTLYQARLNRLYGFMGKLNELDTHLIPNPIECSQRVALENFGLKDAKGNVLFEGINLELSAGDALLIQGASGTGKTTLLKAIAGIYPFETVGRSKRPCNGKILFLPQRPYMPQGSLREAICYPNIDPHHPELERYMLKCHLDKYIFALDQENDWQAILSPGELQRVAFIRIFLTKPDVVFLDETTSALDEPTEHSLYSKIRQALPGMIILSVGHRCTLQQFHTKHLVIGLDKSSRTI